MLHSALVTNYYAIRIYIYVIICDCLYVYNVRILQQENSPSSTTEINDRSALKILTSFVRRRLAMFFCCMDSDYISTSGRVQPGFHSNAGSCCSGDGGVSFHSGAYQERQSSHRVHPRHTIFKRDFRLLRVDQRRSESFLL